MAVTFNGYNTFRDLKITGSINFPLYNSNSATTLVENSGTSRTFYLPSDNSSNSISTDIPYIQNSGYSNSWTMITQDKIINYSSISRFLTALEPESNYNSKEGFHFRTSTNYYAEILSGQWSFSSNTTSVSFTIRFKSSSTSLRSIVLTPIDSSTSNLRLTNVKVYSVSSKSGNSYTITCKTTGYSYAGTVYINYLIYGGY